jgi:hypothetical protein
VPPLLSHPCQPEAGIQEATEEGEQEGGGGQMLTGNCISGAQHGEDGWSGG